MHFFSVINLVPYKNQEPFKEFYMSVERVTYRLGDADLILETGKIGNRPMDVFMPSGVVQLSSQQSVHQVQLQKVRILFLLQLSTMKNFMLLEKFLEVL